MWRDLVTIFILMLSLYGLKTAVCELIYWAAGKNDRSLLLVPVERGEDPGSAVMLAKLKNEKEPSARSKRMIIVDCGLPENVSRACAQRYTYENVPVCSLAELPDAVKNQLYSSCENEV